MIAELELSDWRRRVDELYADVRAASDPAVGHTRWVAGRDDLFRTHQQSPLGAEDPLRTTGLPYRPYDPSLRFDLRPQPSRNRDRRLELPTGENGSTMLTPVGRVELTADRLVVDLNFLYHPSCRYDDAWLCPLAPAENTISARVDAGERLTP